MRTLCASGREICVQNFVNGETNGDFKSTFTTSKRMFCFQLRFAILNDFHTISNRISSLLDSPCLSEVARWIRTKDTNTGHRGIRFPTVRSPQFHDSAQYDEFRAVFIARIHVHSQVHSQETQHLACILTDRLVQYETCCKPVFLSQGEAAYK